MTHLELSPRMKGMEGRELSIEFPTNSEERLDALLATVNRTPKTSTLLMLPDKGWISPVDLWRRFRELHKQTEFEGFKRGTVHDYCSRTFVPIGLVAMEMKMATMAGDETIGFRLTEGGRNYGIQAASLALTFEYVHEMSLYPIFGNTETGSIDQVRAPLTRARILQGIYQTGSSTTVPDLSERLSIPSQYVVQSLARLSEAGVVEYETLGFKGDEIVYSRTQKEEVGIPIYKQFKSFTIAVIEICNDLARRGIEINRSTLCANFPESFREGKNNEYLQHNTVNILRHLMLTGFLHRETLDHKDVLENSRSYVKLTEKGKAVVHDFLTPLQGLSGDDPQTIDWFNKEIVPQTQSDLKELITISSELYYPHSQSYKIKRSRENTAIMIRALIDNKAGLTVKELAELTHLNPSTVREHLDRIRRKHLLTRKRQEGMYIFKIKDLSSGSDTE